MLSQKISQAYIQAMKDKNDIQKQAYGYIVAQIKNKQIELQQPELNDDEVVTVIKKEIKARQEAISFLQQAEKIDDAAHEQAIIDLLSVYVPAMLTKEALTDLVKNVIQTQNITDIPKQRGEIVKAIMADHKAVVDGRLLQEVIGEFM